MAKLIVPAACAIGAAAFFMMRKRHKEEEQATMDERWLAAGAE